MGGLCVKQTTEDTTKAVWWQRYMRYEIASDLLFDGGEREKKFTDC